MGTLVQKKEYFIHPYILQISRIFSFFSYSTLIICWFYTILLFNKYNVYGSYFIKFSIYFSFTLLLLLNLINGVVNKLKKSVYALTDKSLIKVNTQETTIIKFTDIISFRYRRIIFGNGFGTIKTLEKKIYIFFTIKNLGDFVNQLQQYLKNENKTHIFDDQEINAFKKRAFLVDLTRKETLFLTQYLNYTILINFLLNTIVSFILWELPLFFAALWVFFCFSLILGNDLLTRFIFKKGVLKKLTFLHSENTPHADLKTLYTCTSFVTVLIYLCCGICYKKILLLYL